MITAHKKLYENHAEDLTALKKRYEHHACVRVAELTVDPRRREQYLNAALQVCIDEIDAAENGCSGSLTARKTN